MCEFGTWWRKGTDLYSVNAAWLQPKMRRCGGGHPHTKLQGSLTHRAAAYPPDLCREWAARVAAQRGGEPLPPKEDAGPFVLHVPWFNMLLRAGTFSTVRRCSWRSRRHINLLELAMVRQGLEYALLRCGPFLRLIMGVDSLVSCGVANKGRSASRALSREWRKAVGLQVLAGMRFGLHYAPTPHSPADHSPRGRSIPPPTATPPPWWASERIHEDLDLYGNMCFTRAAALWVEFVARLRRRVWLRGRRRSSRDSPPSQYDPTSLEGDGPRAEPLEREGIDLPGMSMVTRPVAARRQKLLERLHIWLQQRGLALSALWLNMVEHADALLSDYGQHCFEEKGSLHDYSETLNAVVAGRPEWRRATAKAWRVARAWRSLVPVQSIARCLCRSLWPCRPGAAPMRDSHVRRIGAWFPRPFEAGRDLEIEWQVFGHAAQAHGTSAHHVH